MLFKVNWGNHLDCSTTMSEIQQQDEIKSTYSYDDWWEGRIFYGPWGQLSVDAYFDSTKKLLADPNYDPFKSDSPKAAFKTIRWSGALAITSSATR